jgi:hypothetical protein
LCEFFGGQRGIFGTTSDSKIGSLEVQKISKINHHQLLKRIYLQSHQFWYLNKLLAINSSLDKGAALIEVCSPKHFCWIVWLMSQLSDFIQRNRISWKTFDWKGKLRREFIGFFEEFDGNEITKKLLKLSYLDFDVEEKFTKNFHDEGSNPKKKFVFNCQNNIFFPRIVRITEISTTQ